MNPYDTLSKHEDLITLVTDHGYIPHKSQLNFRAVIESLKQIDPKGRYDLNCSGCITDIVRRARVYLNIHREKQKTVHHTFPKHDPPVELPKKKRGRPKK